MSVDEFNKKYEEWFLIGMQYFVNIMFCVVFYFMFVK